MNVDDLAVLNIPQEIIAGWKDCGIDELTTLQEICLRSPDLLGGHNTLIIAPTSAGKTFVGEVVAVRSALQLKRVIYVVPFKALAEEKYQQFRTMYEPFGISVAVSSGDRDEFDEDVRRGRYRITVVVNEKLSQLLVQSPGMISDCGVIIFDEIQLIRETNRGPNLEMLLTRLLLSQDRPQIIGLSAAVGALNGFDAWLECTVISSDDRPVPLVEYAVSQNGTLSTYDSTSRRLIQVGTIGVQGRTKSVEDIAAHLVNQGKQVLVFRAHVEATQQTASSLATLLPTISQPSSLLTPLRELDDSEARALLESNVGHGVAFHNAGLSLEERLLVEGAFRQGYVRALVSTTTLAMGVNLPADSVVIGDYRRWDPTVRGERLIDIAEYKNCAGRAGRLNQRESGESFLVVDPQDSEIDVIRRYVSGSPEAIESAIPRSRLIEHVLSAAAARLATTREGMHRLFERSFAAATFYRITGAEALRQGINESILRLSENLLLEVGPTEQIRATALGEVVARLGVSINSVIKMIAFLREREAAFDRPDIIFELCFAEEIATAPPFLRNDERGTTQWRDRVRGLMQDLTEGSSLTTVLTDQVIPNEDNNSALKRCALALLWMVGETPRRLTREFRTGLGYIRTLGENLAWLLESISQMAKALNLPLTLADRLRILAQEVHYGVPFDAVPFARLRVRGLGRIESTRLVRNNTGRVFASYDQVLDAGPDDFVGVINPAIVPVLQEAILRLTNERIGRHKSGLLIRARRLSVPEALIKNLFESAGIDFERAIENILNAPQLSIGVVRLARQRHGEADLYIPLAAGGSILISATASEDNAKPVSWDKAREIFGATGAPAPIRNFVVVGRPDFHETAQRNVEEIAHDDARPMLLLPVAVLGEMCLRVFEGKSTPEALLEILERERGYYAEGRMPETPD